MIWYYREEVEELLLQSCEKYEASLEVKPTYATALDYLGLILIEIKKKKIYLTIFYNHHNNLFFLLCLRLALHHRAKLKEGEQADELYRQAYQKYEAAFKLTSTDEFLICHWAATLHDHAKSKEKEGSERLLHLARYLILSYLSFFSHFFFLFFYITSFFIL